MNPYDEITIDQILAKPQDEQLLIEVHQRIDKGETLKQILDYKSIAYLENFKGEASPKQLKKECDKFWTPIYKKAISQR